MPEPVAFETRTPGGMVARGALSEVTGRPLGVVLAGELLCAVHPGWMTRAEAHTLARQLVYALGDG